MDQRYEDDITIELRELFVLIWKRVPVILFSALAVSFCAFIITKIYITPVYRLEQKLCILTEKETLKNIQGSITEGEFYLNENTKNTDVNTAWIVNDCVELIKSKQILEPVIEDLDLDMTLHQLQEMVTANTANISRILSVNIEGENKREIKQIAKSIKKVASQKLPQILDVKSVIVVEDGKISEGSVSHNLKKNALVGAFLGAFFSICIIIWLFIFDDKIKSTEDIERHLKLNILGVIPDNKESYQKEAYRTFRTNVLFAAGLDKKVIACVNYTLKLDKKKEIAKSLAISMAKTGKKILFIDANMRKTGLEDKGLVQYLSGLDELNDIIIKGDEISVIESGGFVADSTELLENKKFEELIQEVRDRFDYVIIDTPSLENVIDSVVIAGKVDAALAIIEEKSISQKFAKRLNKQLQVSECPILGAILS